MTASMDDNEILTSRFGRLVVVETRRHDKDHRLDHWLHGSAQPG